MPPPRAGARRSSGRAALWIAAALAAGCVRAQYGGTDAPPLVGFPAGPWFIAPSFIAGYSYDSNVLFRPDTLSPSPDRVVTVQPALQLTLPFSNSALTFGDTLRWVDYDKTPQRGGKTANDANAGLSLHFGSMDKLDLTTRRVAGVADTIVFDPGGEAQSLIGNPYDLHSEGFTLSRETMTVRGYRFAVSRSAFSFERPIPFAFIDYRGFDAEAAYAQPLSPNTRLTFGYIGSRYDLYEVGPGSDPAAVFRTENGNTAYGQIEGRLGPRQPYSVRVGWERLTYGLNAVPVDFSGLVGNVNFSFVVGGGTTFSVIAQRQPYRSTQSDENYYVFDQIGGRVVREFRRGSSVGANLLLSRYTYDAPSGGVYRADRAYVLEVYGSLAIQDRVHFRVSILNNRRSSNYASDEYKSLQVFGGFVLGWI